MFISMPNVDMKALSTCAATKMDTNTRIQQIRSKGEGKKKHWQPVNATRQDVMKLDAHALTRRGAHGKVHSALYLLDWNGGHVFYHCFCGDKDAILCIPPQRVPIKERIQRKKVADATIHANLEQVHVLGEGRTCNTRARVPNRKRVFRGEAEITKH